MEEKKFNVVEENNDKNNNCIFCDIFCIRRLRCRKSF